MKTKLLILLSSILISTQAYSQFSIGIVGFPQISMLTNTRDSAQSNMLTFTGGGGITGTYNISKNLGLQLGILYSSQNQKLKSVYTIGDSTYTHQGKKRFDYIKIPLLLRFVQTMGRASFVIAAGPQLSYLLRYDGGMVVYIPGQYFDLPPTPAGNDYYKKIVLDGVISIGMEYSITNTIDITAGIKADYSLTNTENKSAVYNGRDLSNLGLTDRTAHNMTFALTVGVNYNFKSARDLLSPSNKFRGKSYGRKRRH